MFGYWFVQFYDCVLAGAGGFFIFDYWFVHFYDCVLVGTDGFFIFLVGIFLNIFCGHADLYQASATTWGRTRMQSCLTMPIHSLRSVRC